MNWLSKITEDIVNISPMIDYYDRELEIAKKEVAILGSLETNSAKLPGITENRFRQLQEVEAVLEYLNIKLRKETSKHFKKYLEHYNRELSSRDVEKYVSGEDEIITLQEIINEIAFIRNKYLAIMKGLDSKAWQIGNIVRLRSAGLENIKIDD